DLKVTDLMDPHPVTVASGTPTIEAVRLLSERKARCLAVTNEIGQPLGLFAESDLLRAAQVEGFQSAPIERVMVSTKAKLFTEQSTEEAYAAMRRGQLTFIPVVEEEILVGLLDVHDIVPYWAEYMDLKSKRLLRNYDRAMSIIAHDLRTPISLIQTTN